MVCDRATDGLPTAARLHTCSAHLGQFDDVRVVQLFQHSDLPGDIIVRTSPGHCGGTRAKGCSQHTGGASKLAPLISCMPPYVRNPVTLLTISFARNKI